MSVDFAPIDVTTSRCSRDAAQLGAGADRTFGAAAHHQGVGRASLEPRRARREAPCAPGADPPQGLTPVKVLASPIPDE